MKIAFVIHEMTGGGAERVISVLANHLVKNGIEVSVLMTAGNRVEYELEPGVHVVQVGHKTSGNPFVLLKRLKKLRNALKENSFDSVIAFEADTGLYTILANVFRRNNVYISERSNPEKCKNRLLRDFSYSKAKRIIFQTERARDYFSGKIREKAVVIGNPLSDDIPEAYLGSRRKRIVSVGRLGVEKNYFMLIDAFGIFHREHPEYSLHIYGKGELYDELQARIDHMETPRAVHLEGFKNNVTELIRDASMFVMTSDYEGMPNALMEAMAVGLPVVSTDCPIGGPSELIDNGVNGILVPVNDVKVLSDVMSKLADNAAYASLLGKEATKVREKYDVDAICMRWIDAITEM